MLPGACRCENMLSGEGTPESRVEGMLAGACRCENMLPEEGIPESRVEKMLAGACRCEIFLLGEGIARTHKCPSVHACTLSANVHARAIMSA